jgi:hypothetical protein
LVGRKEQVFPRASSEEDGGVLSSKLHLAGSFVEREGRSRAERLHADWVFIAQGVCLLWSPF